jgi:branched-chain amino acid transport system substrate-binding protein
MNRIAGIIILCFFGAMGCQQFRTEGEQRALRAQSNDTEIQIGVVWSFGLSDDGFRNGIEMALEVINQDGGINGQLVKLIYKDDHNDIERGKLAAQEFSENLDLVAVIGHPSSTVAQVASLIYEYTNLVMICPGNTSTALTRTGFEMIFRTLPGSNEMGMHLAQKASSVDGGRVLLVYQNDDFARALANSFESKAEDLRLRINLRLAFDTGALRTFERAIQSLRGDEFDVVALATNAESSLEVIRTLKDAGFEKPIVASIEVERSAFLDKPKLSDGVGIASVFDVNSKDEPTHKFVADYVNKYEKQPTVWAAQGYDALILLADAMKRASTTVPKKVAEALRQTNSFKGVTGSHSFDGRGQVIGKDVFFKKIKGKQLIRIENGPKKGP